MHPVLLLTREALRNPDQMESYPPLRDGRPPWNGPSCKGMGPSVWRYILLQRNPTFQQRNGPVHNSRQILLRFPQACSLPRYTQVSPPFPHFRRLFLTFVDFSSLSSAPLACYEFQRRRHLLRVGGFSPLLWLGQECKQKTSPPFNSGKHEKLHYCEQYIFF